MGCDEGEISEKVCFVKEAIPFEKRETFLDQEHCQSSNLFYVSVRHFKKSELKTREDQKGYPLESGGAWEKAQFGKLVYCLFEQKEWRSWHKKSSHSKLGSPWKMKSKIHYKRVLLEIGHSRKF